MEISYLYIRVHYTYGKNDGDNVFICNFRYYLFLLENKNKLKL